MDSSSQPKTALITGSNGYIGNAVAKAFVLAGYTTYGLVRRHEAAHQLAADEIIPIIGSPINLDFMDELYTYTKTFDVVVSTTEDHSDPLHFEHVLKMLISVGQTSLDHGVRSLVIFSSGCKDYGIGGLHSSHVEPFTEDSPLCPPSVLVPRTTYAQKILQYRDIFDSVTVRPTTLYGGSSSYYGAAFEVAAKAVSMGQGILRISADPQSIMHGTHILDCAAAYVSIAEAPRHKVKGQNYNISTARYETADVVCQALAKEYKLEQVVFETSSNTVLGKEGFDVVGLLFGFSQWISSEKLRQDTGWKDVQPLFSEAIHRYRLSYEAAAKMNHSNVARVGKRIAEWNK